MSTPDFNETFGGEDYTNPITGMGLTDTNLATQFDMITALTGGGTFAGAFGQDNIFEPYDPTRENLAKDAFKQDVLTFKENFANTQQGTLAGMKKMGADIGKSGIASSGMAMSMRSDLLSTKSGEMQDLLSDLAETRDNLEEGVAGIRQEYIDDSWATYNIYNDLYPDDNIDSQSIVGCYQGGGVWVNGDCSSDCTEMFDPNSGCISNAEYEEDFIDSTGGSFFCGLPGMPDCPDGGTDDSNESGCEAPPGGCLDGKQWSSISCACIDEPTPFN